MMAMTMAFPKFLPDDPKLFAGFTTESNLVESAFCLCLLAANDADQFAARRNVGRENLVDAGNYRPGPCLA